jgi:hypothetical protein
MENNLEKYVYISIRHCKTFVDHEGLKIYWCQKILKVQGVIEGAWIVKNYRLKQ